MQLMPATQVLLQVRNPFSAQQSLVARSKLLKLLLGPISWRFVAGSERV